LRKEHFTNQLYWDSVSVGDELPSLSKIATTQTLVKWAGASGDFNPVHYDMFFAQAAGNSGPIVHGALKRQWLVQLVTDWIGDDGTLRKFSCRYRGMDFPRSMKTTGEPEDGETWTCRGRVTRKYELEGDCCVDCDLRVENGNGEATTSGKATVILPKRS
jgi:acyl dehydratase